MGPEELRSQVASVHGGTAALHASVLAISGRNSARQAAQELREVKVNLTLAKRRRRCGGAVGHTSCGGVLAGGEEDGQYGPLPQRRWPQKGPKDGVRQGGMGAKTNWM
jgi:hypothetical protein